MVRGDCSKRQLHVTAHKKHTLRCAGGTESSDSLSLSLLSSGVQEVLESAAVDGSEIDAAVAGAARGVAGAVGSELDAAAAVAAR